MKRDEFNAIARLSPKQSSSGSLNGLEMVGCAHKSISELLSALEITVSDTATVYPLNLSLFKRPLPATTI